ncbi:MAG: hypothetical protein AAF328_06050 [Planctomycetota bacterium]
MGTSDDLLRLLDPAIRPIAPVSPVRTGATPVPFEQQSFDELLDAFGKPNANPDNPAAENAGTPVAEEPRTSQTAPMLDVSRIENASLRTMIAQRDSAHAQDLPT